MKRFSLFAAALLLSLGVSSTVFADVNVSFNVLGGLGWAPNGNMDDSVSWYGNDRATYYNTTYSTSVFKEENDGAGVAYGIDFEPRILFENFAIGVSIGYHVGGESTSTAKASGYTNEQSLSLKLKSTPYLGTLYYKRNLSGDSFLLIGGGIGYYKSTMVVTEEASGFASGNFENEYEFTGSTIGYHARVEANIQVGMVDIIGGLMVRYAKIDTFSNNGNTLTYNGDNVEGNFSGILCYLGAGLMI